MTTDVRLAGLMSHPDEETGTRSEKSFADRLTVAFPVSLSTSVRSVCLDFATSAFRTATMEQQDALFLRVQKTVDTWNTVVNHNHSTPTIWLLAFVSAVVMAQPDEERKDRCRRTALHLFLSDRNASVDMVLASQRRLDAIVGHASGADDDIVRFVRQSLVSATP